MQTRVNVLFLCTHNSARSILGEALLNHLGQGCWRGYSAGSHPRGSPNPLALAALGGAGVSTSGLSSKSWDVFAKPGAPPMDLVITVCDNAAGETCPLWPGGPATVHWGYADPSAAPGDERQRLDAFVATLALMRKRIERLVALPDEALAPARIGAAAQALANAF